MPESSPPEAFGHLDQGTLHTVSGWAFDPRHPNDAVELEVLERDRLICRAQAALYRADLEQSGYGDGRHGFTIDLPASAFLAPVVDLRVRVRSTGQELQGSPLILLNRHVLLTPDTLAEMAGAIASTAATAQSGKDLQDLALWLLRQLDTVWAAQSALAGSARARSNRFFELVGENASLSSLLRQAAEAVVQTYKPLHLPDTPHPEVSVIIPVQDRFASTYRCLAAILRHRPAASLDVTVVDDGCVDETVYAGFILSGGIRLLRTGATVGFVQAVNQAAAVARGKYLFLLGNETEVQEHWLDELLAAFADDATIGIAGAKLIRPDGRLHQAGGIVWRQGTVLNYGESDDPANPDYAYRRDADCVSGAALMLPRALFQQLGGLSPAFAPAFAPAPYADTDLCFKARAAGRRVVVQPQSCIVHHGDNPPAAAADHGERQRINQRVFTAAWSEPLQRFPLHGTEPRAASQRLVQRRALVIGGTAPAPDQDPESAALLGHMRGLQRLGYQVCFVGADTLANIGPHTQALERVGIHCYYAPYYRSVEEILRCETLPFELFVIHRAKTMLRYGPMIRQHSPAARIVLAIGGSQRPHAAPPFTPAELPAIHAADSIIVPTSHERDALAQAGVAVPRHVVPATVRPNPSPAPFEQRSGLALIAGEDPAELDAAAWLAGGIMPLLAPHGITCVRAGSHAPAPEPPHATPSVLDQVRLTVAPARAEAALHASVLASLAAGVPCVMTRHAAAGLALPAIYDAAIADTEAGLAACILQLHADAALFAQLRAAGLDVISQTHAPAQTDALLAAACGRTEPAAADPPPHP